MSEFGRETKRKTARVAAVVGLGLLALSLRSDLPPPPPEAPAIPEAQGLAYLHAAAKTVIEAAKAGDTPNRDVYIDHRMPIADQTVTVVAQKGNKTYYATLKSDDWELGTTNKDMPVATATSDLHLSEVTTDYSGRITASQNINIWPGPQGGVEVATSAEAYTNNNPPTLLYDRVYHTASTHMRYNHSQPLTDAVWADLTEDASVLLANAVGE